ncbi:type VII secretion integral membrane protein EccD [Nocardia miyunensis]|uniref:type VII secretion integral membrane protein EccD n=1 Tax=Nocardia miyunensis TaxID=282684 RepID=UPI000AA1C88D|nr:type VII secretion integral membrane protein EccD [Nocardia miyunensis]
MIEPSTVEPQLCRVSVIGGNTQVDLALPAEIPVANFIPEVVALIASRNPNPSEREDGDAALRAEHWTLSRLGHEPIDPDRTLTEADVFDGELLILRELETVEAPALFDDVIDAVARLTENASHSWTSDSAGDAGRAAAIAGGIGAALLLPVAAVHGAGLVAGFAGLGLGLLALVAATLVARMYADKPTATALSVSGLALSGGSAAALVPGGFGAPNLLLGSAATLLLSVLMLRLIGTGTAVFTTLITTATLGTAVAGAITLWHFPIPKVGVVAMMFAILIVTFTPRIAVAAARLPVPPVPTAGAAIDPRDHELRPTIEGIGAIGATTIPSAVGLDLRSQRANDYQTGMLVGLALTAVAGALAAAVSADHRWQGAVIAAAAGLVLCRRSRIFADRTQAATLVLGGGVILVGLPILLGTRMTGLALFAAGALVVFAVISVLVGVVAPRANVSPVTQRAAEILEYLCICAIGPLAFWFLNIYSLARNA